MTIPSLHPAVAEIPLFWLTPFALLLLLIAAMPLATPRLRHWWERSYPVVSLGLAAGTASPEERQLNIYHWADYIGPDTIKAFEKETGIKVTYDNFDSYEALDAKILTGSSGYDIIFPDSTLAYHHLKAGLYKALDKSKLPNFKNLDPFVLEQLRAADPSNDHVVPYMWWTNGLV